MQVIQQRIWQKLPIDEQVLNNSEKEFARQYRSLLRTMSGAYEQVGILESVETVPQELFVDCRVIRHGGQVQTEYGMIRLETGCQLYLRWTDVEPLMTAGFVALVDNS